MRRGELEQASLRSLKGGEASACKTLASDAIEEESLYARDYMEGKGDLDDARHEDVGHALRVRVPVGAVLLRAARVVAHGSMDNHGHEEADVPVGQQDLEAADQAPA